MTSTSHERRSGASVIPDGLLAALEQLCLVVDRLWMAAEEDGSEVGAVSLGDASMALHKALVVLIEKGNARYR